MTKASKIVDMPPMDIRIALIRGGRHLQKKIASELQVSKTAVYRTIEGKLVSDRIRRAIADEIGLDVARIWPSTYLYGGGPAKRGRPGKTKH